MNNQPKLQCPFNRSHWILNQRFAKHLQQCKKAYPLADLVECSFKATHYFPSAEIKNHEASCEYRRNVERVIAPAGPGPSNSVPDDKYKESIEGDDWDKVTDHVSYIDARPELLKNRAIYSYGELNTGKAKRRDHLLAEKKRHESLS